LFCFRRWATGRWRYRAGRFLQEDRGPELAQIVLDVMAVAWAGGTLPQKRCGLSRIFSQIRN
jgi:hypothetical protein